MIQITAYLRDEEDLKLWKDIGNKTAFLHDALRVQNNSLQGTMYPKPMKNSPFEDGTIKAMIDIAKPDIIKTPEDAKEQVMKLTKPKPEKQGKLCEHGQLKGECLVKGCPFNTRF